MSEYVPEGDRASLKVSFHVLPPFLLNSPLAAIGYVRGFLSRSLPEVRTRTMYWNQAIARDCLTPALLTLLTSKGMLFQNTNALFFEALFAHIFGSLHANPEGLQDLADTVGGLSFGEIRPGTNSFNDIVEQVRTYIIRRIKQEGFDQDNITACTAQLNQIIPSLALLRLLKEYNPKTITVMGGLSAKKAAMIMSRFSFVDVCVFGEGERCFSELCRRVGMESDLSSLPGAIVRVNGAIRENNPSPSATDIDHNWALWEGFDWALPFELGYTDVLLPVWDSRGCPWAKCRFCHRVDRPFRERSSESITEEIAYQMRQHPCLERLPKVIVQMIGDQLRGSSTNRLEKLLDGLGQLKDRYPNQEMFGWLSPAHTSEKIMQQLHRLDAKVQWGFEQWSSKVLKLMDKPHTVEHGFYTLKLADKYSAVEIIGPNYLVGFPGERLEDVYEAQRNLQKLRFILASLGERVRFEAAPVHVQPSSILGTTFAFNEPLVRQSLANHPHSRLFALMAEDVESAIEHAMELEFAAVPDSNWTARLGQFRLAAFNDTLQHTQINCFQTSTRSVALQLVDPFGTQTIELSELEKSVLEATEGITSINKLERDLETRSLPNLSMVVAKLEDLDLLYVNPSRRRCINTLPHVVQQRLLS